MFGVEALYGIAARDDLVLIHRMRYSSPIVIQVCAATGFNQKRTVVWWINVEVHKCKRKDSRNLEVARSIANIRSSTCTD